MKILHTCLNVSDLDRSIDFYTKNLGLVLGNRHKVQQNNAEIAFMRDDTGNAIELTYWAGKKISEGDNFDHIAFETGDVSSAVKTLKGNGVTIAMEPFSLQGSKSKIAFIKDPDGNWLELVERH